MADGSTTYSNLTTDVSQIVDLDISDQFGQQLDTLYDDDGVVKEFLDDLHVVGNTDKPPSESKMRKWKVIEYPDLKLRDGRKADQAAHLEEVQVNPGLEATERMDWAAFKLTRAGKRGGEGNNVYSANSVSGVWVYSQRLKVHGHLLGDVYTRITYFFPINYVDSTNSPMRVYDVPR